MTPSHDLQIWRAAMLEAIEISRDKMCGRCVDVLIARRAFGPSSPLPPDPELDSLRAKVADLEEANEKARFRIAELMQELEMYREATRHRYDREGHDRGVMTSPHKGKVK